MMEQMLSKGLEEKFNASMAYKEASVHGSSDSGNISGEENKEIDFNDVKQQVQSTIRAGSKRTPMEIEEAIMRKKLRNRESAQRARDRQKARMRWLEEEMSRITGKNDQMLKENLLLRQVLGEQGQKINELVRREEERTRKSESVKTEPVETPKKTAFWRPGIEDTPAPAKPAVLSAEEQLAKMRLAFMPESNSTQSTYNPHLALEASQRLQSSPYFPLGASLSTPYSGGLSNGKIQGHVDQVLRLSRNTSVGSQI